MIHHTRFLLSIIALGAISFGAASAGAGAQVPPPSAAPSAPASAMPDEPGPQATAAPATSAPATAAPATAAPARHIKKLKEGTLPFGQVKFALTHPLQEAKQLRNLHTVKFDNIRVVRLSKLNIKGLKAMNVDLLVAHDAFGSPVTVAALPGVSLPSSNGSNSPIQYLQNVLANINVSNALNDVLNNSTVNLNVSLSDVLNNNKIAIGQVVGVYVGGGGLINTIVK